MRDYVTTVLASRHVAGRELDDALRICRWAESQDYRSVVSPWSGPQDNWHSMFTRYAAALDAISHESPGSYVSIKLEAIGYDLELFRDLTTLAGVSGVRIHIDSLGPETADTALDFAESAAILSHPVGYTLASRWTRSLRDAERVAEMGIPVRIVKGQWEDSNSRGLDCRQNYLDIADKFLGGRASVGVATHDVSLAKMTLTRLKYGNTNCELEQFFSLPLNGIPLASKLQCPYRIYIAYGHPGIPYNIRFTFTRPSIATWVFADFALHLKKPWSQN